MAIREIKTGQDSFLDITANLVGILIILVVVVGAQARQSWTSSQPSPEKDEILAVLQRQVEHEKSVANQLTKDNQLLEQQIDKEAAFEASLSARRQRMLVKIELMKNRIEEKSKSLDAERRESFDKQVAKAALEAELDALKSEAIALQSLDKQIIETIDHYPAPVAKTVLSDEVHFRLANGKLMYVPMDELTLRMKSEWRTKAEKLRNAPTTVEMVGPVNGFRMQYQLESLQALEPNGRSSNNIVRLKRFVMIPVVEDGGETILQAMKKGSDFQKKIWRRQEKNTTVSIWVYPDSFQQYNQIRSWLRENGVQTACWPLAEGKLISGSPNGLKSAAQQ